MGNKEISKVRIYEGKTVLTLYDTNSMEYSKLELSKENYIEIHKKYVEFENKKGIESFWFVDSVPDIKFKNRNLIIDL